MSLNNHLLEPEPPRRTVLLVEDDAATLRFYQTGLKALREFRVLLAEHGGKAQEVLKEEPVDVLVTDLRMPVMDGFRLISWVSSRHPGIPVIVLTEVPEEEHQNRPLDLGALRILSKPPRLSRLMEEIRAAARRPPDGSVQGIALESLLQLLNWERKSCTLTVRSPDGHGVLYLRSGEVIHAACRDQEGLSATYAILQWRRPLMAFVGTCRMQPTMDLSMAEILMNAAMIRDIQETLPPQASA